MVTQCHQMAAAAGGEINARRPGCCREQAQPGGAGHQPSAATQTGCRVLFDLLPKLHSSLLHLDCMCELQPLPAEGIKQKRAHGARAALGTPCP